ncbi:thiolase C-terminal domain-containing protein [Massilia cavernae]|uniref:Transporter n=1 Tax=Massilia cavernae TaxID=2320864 RepID=A0A418Y0P9_9BURK|nr:transporter [Massilia cavernae]RJG18837.1 transporter [Massilia cavernae]
MSHKPFCGGVSVAGIGLRQYKRGTAPMPEQGVLVRAIVDACEDAGFDPADVDGFVAYGDDHNEPVRLMPDLGTRNLLFNAQAWGGGGGGIAAAFGIAAAAIASGQATAVVVFRALVQGNSGRLSAAVMRHFLNDHVIGGGMVAPAQVCALRARRLFEHHKVPLSVAEELVRASYYHGSRNPEATAFGKDLDLDAYRNGRMIAEPFRLFDCSRENDGAGALLLVSTERAKDLRKRPIRVLGVANGASKGWGDLAENDEDYASAGFKPVAQRLWQQTGLGPADVDVIQLYENFSAQGVSSLIDHGFCTYENVAEVVRFENLIAPTGKLPLNTSGGNFAHGFVHGIGTAIEAVRVLRGESANPVPDAKVCLLAGGPGAPTVSSALFGTDDL